MSLLIAQSLEQHVHIQFRIQSIKIFATSPVESKEKPNSTLKSSLKRLINFCGKVVDVKNLSIQLSVIKAPVSSEEFEALFSSQIVTQSFESSLLNPMNLTVQLNGEKLRGSSATFDNIQTMVISASIQNLEWTPSLTQLKVSTVMFNFLSVQVLKSKIRFVYDTKEAPFRGKLRFIYIVKVIIALLKVRNGGLSRLTDHYHRYRLKLRNQYKILYSRILNCRLQEASNELSTSNVMSDIVHQQFECTDLSAEDRKYFGLLCVRFHDGEQLQIRFGVHREILETGLHRSTLVAAIMNLKKKNSWNFFKSSKSDTQPMKSGNFTFNRHLTKNNYFSFTNNRFLCFDNFRKEFISIRR